MNNLKPFNYSVKASSGRVIWLFGLSGSGKSTLADSLEIYLRNKHISTFMLDGDLLRQGLCKDLSFSQTDRTENLRRAAEVAKLISLNGPIVICNFITPLKEQRKMLKEIINHDLKLVFIDTSITVCQERDPKGLYKKASLGELNHMTGISSDFQAGTDDECDYVLSNSHKSSGEAAEELIKALKL